MSKLPKKKPGRVAMHCEDDEPQVTKFCVECERRKQEAQDNDKN